jgi:hypothetical protein
VADAAVNVDANDLKLGPWGEQYAEIAKGFLNGGDFWAAGATDRDLYFSHGNNLIEKNVRGGL